MWRLSMLGTDPILLDVLAVVIDEEHGKELRAEKDGIDDLVAFLFKDAG